MCATSAGKYYTRTTMLNPSTLVQSQISWYYRMHKSQNGFIVIRVSIAINVAVDVSNELHSWYIKIVSKSQNGLTTPTSTVSA